MNSLVKIFPTGPALPLSHIRTRATLPFVVNYLEPNPGPIYDAATGATVGTHGGLWTYTIGQGARLPGLKEKHFIVAKSKEDNALYVVNGS